MKFKNSVISTFSLTLGLTTLLNGFSIDWQYGSSGNNYKDAFIVATWKVVIKRLEEVIIGPNNLKSITVPAGERPPGVISDYNDTSLWASFQLPEIKVQDMFILVLAGPIDGKADPNSNVPNTLAESTIFAERTYEKNGTTHYFPYFSLMQIDIADANPGDPSGVILDNVVLHEAIHSLGFENYTWDLNGVLEEADHGEYRFMGPHAIEEWRKALNNGSEPNYVPVDQESQSHWDEDVFAPEIMCPFAHDIMPISTVTLGAMKDLGWEVNYTNADTSRYPFDSINHKSFLTGGRALESAVNAEKSAYAGERAKPLSDETVHKLRNLKGTKQYPRV